MRYWWVNQNQTYRQEQSGGYLWSPKRKSNGARNRFYDTMREVSPGDLILSFKGTYLCTIGVARSHCYDCIKPQEFGDAGAHWQMYGWRTDVQWTELANKIRPMDHIDVIRPTLPARYAPIQAKNGGGLQGVYLAEIPAPMMQILAGLIGYEVRLLMDRQQPAMASLVADRDAACESSKRSWENYLEQEIRHDERLRDTEKQALVWARRGQGEFRRNVQLLEQACRITKVGNPEHLIASHCKPWRHAANDERLDGENGLMLTPTVDHLFDRGFISFEDNGRLLISPVADAISLQRMGIDTSRPVQVGTFSSGQKKYLDYHRNQILLATP